MDVSEEPPAGALAAGQVADGSNGRRPPAVPQWEPLYLDSDVPGTEELARALWLLTHTHSLSPGYPVRAAGRTRSRYHADGRWFSSALWEGVYVVGRVLSWPTTTIVSLFCRAFLMPFRPGADRPRT